jgi:hypothetical protein
MTSTAPRMPTRDPAAFAHEIAELAKAEIKRIGLTVAEVGKKQEQLLSVAERSIRSIDVAAAAPRVISAPSALTAVLAHSFASAADTPSATCAAWRVSRRRKLIASSSPPGFASISSPRKRASRWTTASASGFAEAAHRGGGWKPSVGEMQPCGCWRGGITTAVLWLGKRRRSAQGSCGTRPQPGASTG